jgi:hypothetical protein
LIFVHGSGVRYQLSAAILACATALMLVTAPAVSADVASIMGGVVPVYRLEGIAPGEVKFTGKLLADIYLGKVKTWSDPAIVELNANLKLPAKDITVLRRADMSDTTLQWTNFLSKASPDFNQAVGAGTSVRWPVGVGAKGNEGVALYLQKIDGALGYVDYAYAQQNKLSYGQVQELQNSQVAAGQSAAGSAEQEFRTTDVTAAQVDAVCKASCSKQIQGCNQPLAQRACYEAGACIKRCFAASAPNDPNRSAWLQSAADDERMAASLGSTAPVFVPSQSSAPPPTQLRAGVAPPPVPLITSTTVDRGNGGSPPVAGSAR